VPVGDARERRRMRRQGHTEAKVRQEHSTCQSTALRDRNARDRPRKAQSAQRGQASASQPALRATSRLQMISVEELDRSPRCSLCHTCLLWHHTASSGFRTTPRRTASRRERQQMKCSPLGVHVSSVCQAKDHPDDVQCDTAASKRFGRSFQHHRRSAGSSARIPSVSAAA